MKHRIFKRYKTRKRGGQRYWVRKRLKNYGMKFMNKRDMNRLIIQREKEGIIVVPTYEGYLFYNPNTREMKSVFEAKRKNFGSLSDDITIDIGREMAERHRKRLKPLKELIHLEGTASQDTLKKIRDAENVSILLDVQNELSNRLFKKNNFYDLDKNQQVNISKLIRKNIETSILDEDET